MDQRQRNQLLRDKSRLEKYIAAVTFETGKIPSPRLPEARRLKRINRVLNHTFH